MLNKKINFYQFMLVSRTCWYVPDRKTGNPSRVQVNVFVAKRYACSWQIKFSYVLGVEFFIFKKSFASCSSSFVMYNGGVIRKAITVAMYPM
jgi:hypothetical protein